jgi:ABC-type phosphate/phosphonate transport system substrate-binding protein
MEWMRLSKSGIVVALLFAAAFAGCLGGGDAAEEDANTIRIAFTIKDDYDDPDVNPQHLADYIASETGYNVELFPIASDNAAIEALRFGHADVAFLDGGAGFVAWKSHGLEAVLADQKSDGSTAYTAAAWVRNSSDITSLDQLAGKNACHTVWQKTAGMLMPMGYLIGNGLVQVQGPTDEIESLRTTIEAHFGQVSIPEKGDLYYGYDGAFRCMTEGEGDVAFVKTSSFGDHCESNAWCLDRDEYRILEPHFGQVPSHPIMVNLDDAGPKQDALITALLSLNDSPEGQAILESVLNTPGLTEVTSESHLGSYSDNIEHIPGITAYFEDKYDD